MPRAVVRFNAGHWIADCPRPGCANAEHAGPHRVTGHVGGLGGAVFRCSNCELTCPTEWPPNVEDIERLLAMRPVPETRNWWPGETLTDLLAENIAHGLIPPGLEDGGWVQITDDRIDAGSAIPAVSRQPLGR